MWTIAGRQIKSRLLLGSALYPSLEIMSNSVAQSQANIITLSVQRQAPEKNAGANFWNTIQALNCHLLPNTAGCRSAKDAIRMAHLTRELFDTPWVKLEVIGDDYSLQPDPFELVLAAKQLIKDGFEVFPYCTEDLVLCQRLVDVGCNILMPWAAPIGSGQGLLNVYALETLRQRMDKQILIIDAGIGKPSQAAQAMEMGFDGILLNSAIALANDPVEMAVAFKNAVVAGRQAYKAGLMPKRNLSKPSTPLMDTPFWLQEKS